MKIPHLFFVITLSFISCSLFKKTTLSSSQSSVKQTEISQLVLKQANKETQIFTYWNDTGYYQIQTIKEQVDEARSGTLKAEEKLSSKEKMLKKEPGLVNIWFWAAILVLLIIYFSYLRLKRTN